MKSKEIEVKSKSRTVATVEVPVYDSLQEAIEHEGEEKVLELFNQQNKTNIMNAARTAATQKLSKSVLRDRAFAELTVEEFQSVAGDQEALKRLIEKKMAEIEARVKAEQEAAGNGDEEEDEEGEE